MYYSIVEKKAESFPMVKVWLVSHQDFLWVKNGNPEMEMMTSQDGMLCGAWCEKSR